MKTSTPKTYFIETFGCQANESDSAKLARILTSYGFVANSNPFASDVYIINSCSVRQKSEDKVYGLARKLNKSSSQPFVVLAGCMVGSVKGDRVRYSFEELKKKTPWVDLYLSPDEILLLPNFLIEAGIISKNTRKVTADYSNASSGLKKGQINISYGCDNFCSYCVVPYSRGAEISRPKEAILKEIEEFVSNGISDITLCGQNVNSWGLSAQEKKQIRIGDATKLPFAQLLREVHALSGVEKITFISSNPFDFTQDLVDTLALPKIDNYLHIAVQSGNNDILSKMNRRHRVEEFIDLINRIKKVKPDVELGTDIIVGFPGETEDQFMDTVRLFQQIRFNVAFISMYSPRKGTFADKNYPDDISLSEKRRRHKVLTKVWRETLKK